MKLLLYILIIIMPLQVFSQDVNVPVDLQCSILIKILPLERKLSQKINEKKSMKILILFQNKYRKSLNERNTIIETFEKFSHKNYVVNELIYNDDSQLKHYLATNNTDVLIVTSLKAVDLSQISDISITHQILTFTTTPFQVAKGFSIAIELIQDKPQIIINLPQLKSEGAFFSSHLLKLARIIE